jgi:hypothetical protein
VILFAVEEAEVSSVCENGALSVHTSEWVQPSLKTKEKFSINNVRSCYSCSTGVTVISNSKINNGRQNGSRHWQWSISAGLSIFVFGSYKRKLLT